MTAIERLLCRVTITEDGCWIDQKPSPVTGYSVAFDRCANGRTTSSGHRLMYEHFKGPIPRRHVLDHYRMNPGPRHAPCAFACINPDHLEPVSRGENGRRAHRGRKNQRQPVVIVTLTR